MSDLDKQIFWFNEYKTDPIKVGMLCEEFPGLQKAWEQFQTLYELCGGQDDCLH
jgi:hypothetical protein